MNVLDALLSVKCSDTQQQGPSVLCRTLTDSQGVFWREIRKIIKSVLVALDLQPPIFKRLHQHRGYARDHESCRPHHVEIEPCLAKNGQAKFAIDHPRDEPGDRNEFPNLHV